VKEVLCVTKNSLGMARLLYLEQKMFPKRSLLEDQCIKNKKNATHLMLLE